jgi:hypothetical protein
MPAMVCSVIDDALEEIEARALVDGAVDVARELADEFVEQLPRLGGQDLAQRARVLARASQARADGAGIVLVGDEELHHVALFAACALPAGASNSARLPEMSTSGSQPARCRRAGRAAGWCSRR